MVLIASVPDLCISFTRQGDSNRYSQDMILWSRAIITFYQLNTNPTFPPFFLYVRFKRGLLLYGDVSVMGALIHVAQLGERRTLDRKVAGLILEQDTSSQLLSTG